MKGAYAIFKREVLSYLVSPMAYSAVAAFLVLGAYFFFSLLEYYHELLERVSSMPVGFIDKAPNLNQDIVEPYYQSLMILFVFIIPLFTMRLISEERRSGTFEYLVISPSSAFGIVLGKFLGAAVLGTLLVLVSFGFPLTLCIFAEPEIPPMLAGLLGLFLYTLSFISIGLAISAMTSSPFIGALSGMVTLLLLYLIHTPAERLGGAAAQVLVYLSPALNAREMAQGIISSDKIIYFLSLITVGLFFASRSLDAQRWR